MTVVTVTASDSTDPIQAEASFTVVVYDPPEIRTDTEMSGIVDPYEETSREPSKDGSLTVTFPDGSMSNYDYYQARIDPDSDECGSQVSVDNDYLCLSVDLFNLAADSHRCEALRQERQNGPDLGPDSGHRRDRTPSIAEYIYILFV